MAKIPEFASLAEEAEFRDTHDPMEADVTFEDARPRKTQISLRLDPKTITRLKTVAQQRGVGYQTLIRMWVMERLSQESH
jgi:predicted DNA binding CopG/RHH family protein